MNTALNLFRRYGERFLTLLIILSLYGVARLPSLSDSSRAALASGFHFTSMPLPGVSGRTARFVRAVHPDFAHFAGWISSVGASVALNDLNGDGLPNDVCYVDVRIDQVIVAPAPGAPADYQPFALNPAPLAYDPDTMAPMGCLPGDFNEDGMADILVYYWGRTPVIFLRSSNGSSRNPVSLEPGMYTPRELNPAVERWYSNAATQADLDGDGHLDLIIGNYFADGSRILDAKAKSGERMHDSMSRSSDGGRNRIFLSASGASGKEPKQLFKEATGVLDEKVARGWTLAVGAADLDGDLLPEIYFANDFGPDRLLHNCSKPGELCFSLLEGRKTFTTPNSKVVGRDSFKGMGVDFGDLNGDGLLDIYVSNIAAEFALEESHFAFLSTGELALMKEGIAPYIDHSESLGLSRSGWAWESRLGDFNNDGILEAVQAIGFMKGSVNRWPELHEIAMGNDALLHHPGSWHRFQPGDDLGGGDHNAFFVRAQDGRYYDLAREIGLAQAHVSRGISTADINGDGKLDFAVANQWETSYLLINDSQNVGAFLGLHLLLPLRKEGSSVTTARPGHPNVGSYGRAAIGASVVVCLPDGRRLVAQVDGGNGHSGKRSQSLHFGLGYIPSDTQLSVEICWRDPEGRIHSESLELIPGWHTVLLGW